MADSFIDIAPGNAITVLVSGKQISVSGLSLRLIASLLLGYPALLDLLFTRSEERKELSAIDIIKVAPDAVVDIILYGVNMHGNKKAKEVAEHLPGGEQIILLTTIIKQTIGSGGFAPLVECVEELAGMTKPLQDAVGETDGKYNDETFKQNSPSQLNG